MKQILQKLTRKSIFLPQSRQQFLKQDTEYANQKGKYWDFENNSMLGYI